MDLKSFWSKIEEKVGLFSPEEEQKIKENAGPAGTDDGTGDSVKDEIPYASAEHNVAGNDSGISEKTQEEEPVKNEDVHTPKENFLIPDSSLETSKMVWELLLKSMDVNYRHKENIVSGKVLEAWLCTSSRPVFELYQDMKDELRIYLSNEGGYDLKDVVFVYGEPEDKNDYFHTETYPIYYRIKGAVEDSVQHKEEKEKTAFIRSMEGRLKKECYKLSSEELKKIKSYNIGRGEVVAIRGIRHNHIAIDENGGTKENCVSRAHARIGYLKELGFYLQPEEGGCLAGGNRTRIIRGNDLIDLENTLRTEPLRDGDIIELAKSVYLRFEEID